MNGLRLKEAAARIGVKRTKFYELVNKKILPPPVKIGRASIWIAAELDQALAKLAFERDAKKPA